MLRALLLAAVFAAPPIFAPALADERPSPLQPSDSWDAIRFDVVGDAEIRDGSDLYTLEAPFRAEDAATVPVRIVQAPDAPDPRRLILVIDENPSPLAAEFAALHPGAYRGTVKKLRGEVLDAMAEEIAADRSAGAIPTV